MEFILVFPLKVFITQTLEAQREDLQEEGECFSTRFQWLSIRREKEQFFTFLSIVLDYTFELIETSGWKDTYME